MKQNISNKDFWSLLRDWQKEDIEAGLLDLKNDKVRPVMKVLAKYHHTK